MSSSRYRNPAAVQDGQQSLGHAHVGNATKIATAVVVIVLIEMVAVLAIGHRANAPVESGDGTDYHNLAVNLLQAHIYSRDAGPPLQPTMYRSPGYPLFLAGIYAVTGPSPPAVRISQFVLLGATAFLVYLLARRLVSERASEIASLICVTYPPFVASATYHLSETLASLVVVLALLLLYQTVTDSPRFGTALSAGAALGFLVLVRSFLALLIVLAVAMVLGRTRREHMVGKACQISVALVLGFALVAGPWMIRNIRMANAFVPLGVTGGLNLWQGAEQLRGRIGYRLSPSEWHYILEVSRARFAEAGLWTKEHPEQDVPASIQTELHWDRLMMRQALADFHSVPTMHWLASVPIRVRFLWAATDRTTEPFTWWQHCVDAIHLLLLIATAAGIVLSRKSLLAQWPLWILAVCLSLIFVPVFSIEARYSLGARPALFVYAGVALARVFGERRSAVSS